MSKITITIDTEENMISANIDGKEITNISSASVYQYNDYYNKNKPKLSWNISTNNETNDDDFTSYTHYCSAGEIAKAIAANTKQDWKTARADIVSYYSNTKGK